MSLHGTLELRRESAVIAQDQTGELSLVDIIGKIAQTPNLTLESVQALTQLVELQERKEGQLRKERFFAALQECQKEMPRVGKNGFIDPKGANIPYAKLEDLDACIRPIYELHGFSVFYDAPTTEAGKIRTTARFTAFGHTESTEITAAPDAGDMGRLKTSPVQAVKKTITASRRHLLEMFFNVITVDADTDGMHRETATVTQNQADDIRTRMNDLPQRAPGSLLGKLCEKYGVNKPEDIRVSQFIAVGRDVELTEQRFKK